MPFLNIVKKNILKKIIDIPDIMLEAEYFMFFPSPLATCISIFDNKTVKILSRTSELYGIFIKKQTIK